MFRKLTATANSFPLTVLRLVLGVVFFAHGAQKMLSWFGGKGFSAALHNLVPGMHIPVFFAFLAICAEFFGGLGLMAGLLTRVAAFGILVNMVVAVALVEGHNGFFMNWEGQKTGEGYEYHLLALAMTFLVMVRGAGALSADRQLASARQIENL